MRTVKADVRRALAISFACVCGVCCGHGIAGERQPKEKPIVILYENDVHCAIDGYGVMERLRGSICDTAWVAVTSSGDFLQGGVAGALSKGRYVADIMKKVEYDAVTLGNHEFDFGIPHMRQLLHSAGIPVTCVNFRDTEGDSLVYAPYIIKEYGKRKVAFVGVVTPSTLDTEAYAFHDGVNPQKYDLCAREVYGLVQKAVDEARGQGAGYVVALAHLGEEENPQDVDSHGLVAATTGIDAVLDGHTHSVVECCLVRNAAGHMIPVSQTGTKFANIGKLYIDIQGRISTHLIPAGTFPMDDKSSKNTVQQAVDSVKTLMKRVTDEEICRSPFPLVVLAGDGSQLVRYAETNAGDIVTDALRIYTGADAAIINGGGVRADIAAGAITVGDVIAMLPYDNPVTVVSVTGQELQELLSLCCQNVPKESGDFPQVSGIRLTLCKGRPNAVRDVMVLNAVSGEYEPVVPAKTYTLATIEYAVSGGGLHGRLANANRVRNFDKSDCGILIWYLREKLQGIVPERYSTTQDRIR